MRATRRYWGVAALGGFLVSLAVLLDAPVLLAGATGVGAWLIASQYRFYRALDRVVDTLDVEQTVARGRVSVDEDVSIVVSVALPRSAPLHLAVRSDLPIATDGPSRMARTARLVPGQREASATCTVSWPVAGAYDLGPPTLIATDGLGLLRERLSHGPGTSVTVEPRGPRNVHVGIGGQEIATAYGEHPAGRLGSGFDPAELREYVPGDPADRIDWKATARLAEPFVREYEAETDRRTALLIDHRGSMATGPEGETKLDYLREAALAFVASARRLNDPIGCYTVGDGGVTSQHAPEATHDQFVRVRSLLYGLRPTRRDDADGSTRYRGTPAAARSATSVLDGDDPFAATLRPYFADAVSYVRRVHDDPLFETVRASVVDLRGSLRTAIFTDDVRRRELREAVKLARRGDDQVLVFLAPTVLFEPGGLGDLESAYDRYVDFEEFRKELARLPRVHVFEVGPGDRLDAVLAATRNRRTRRAAGGV